MLQTRAGRKTSRGIVVHDGKVLLIERWRTDEAGTELHYFSIPGGGIEAGEIPEVTVVRELYEETSLLVRPSKLLATQSFEDGSLYTYFLCEYLSGSPAIHPTATEVQLETNHSKPRWITKAQFAKIVLNEKYEPLRKVIAAAFKNKLPKKLLTIK